MDDPDWRAAITSILITVPPGAINKELIGIFDIHPGKISGKAGNTYAVKGLWTWTIKATGYEDTIVIVAVQ